MYQSGVSGHSSIYSTENSENPFKGKKAEKFHCFWQGVALLLGLQTESLS
jgi:hypothetical protein